MVSLAKLGRVRAYAEGSFYAVDATGSLASFFDVPFAEGTAEITVTRDELDPGYALTDRRAGRARVLGKRSGTLKFSMALAPTGSPGTGDTSTLTGALQTLLGSAWGTVSTPTGTTFSTDWSTGDTGDVTSAAGLAAGDTIGWVNSDGVMEVARIKSKSSNTLVLDHAFSDGPFTNDVCYAGITIAPAKTPTNMTMQFLVEGAESADRWLALGCSLVGAEITSDPTGKAIPSIAFTYNFPLFLYSDETAGSVTGALGDATFNYYAPIEEYQGIYRMMPTGSSTYSATHTVPISAHTWKPKTTVAIATSPSATPTISGGSPQLAPIGGYMGGAPIEGSFAAYMDSLAWWDARDAKTTYCQRYQIGYVPAYTLVLCASTVEVLNPQRAASDSEIEGQTVNFLGLKNVDTALTTDLATAPFLLVLI